MKKLVTSLLLSILAISVFANINSDSLAYQLQRKKINAMLAQRSIKFGRYDESLKMHTGIFGFQTKKDIRNSNDILMDIVATDDTIYQQLKILLDYHVFQEKQLESHSVAAEQSNVGYMTTINKLRSQVDQLKADAETQRQSQQEAKNLFIIIVIVLLGVLCFTMFKKRSRA